MTAPDPFKSGFVSPEPKAYEPSMEEILASIRRIIADDQSLPGRASQRESEANLRAALDLAQPRQEPEATPIPPDRPAFLRSPNAESAAALHRHPVAQQAPQPAQQAPQNMLHAPQHSPDTGKSQPVAFQPGPQDVPHPPEPRGEPALRPLNAPLHQGHIAAPQFAMPDPGPLAPVPPAAPPQISPQAIPDTSSQASGLSVAPDLPALLSDTTRDAVAEAFNRLAFSRLAGNNEAFKEMVRDILHPMLKSWLDENLPALIDRLVRDEIERATRGGR